MAGQSHEQLSSFRLVTSSSSRKFGITVGVILCFLGLWPLVRYHRDIHVWLLALGTILFILGIVAPRALDKPNQLWFKLGLLLAKISNPIVMGIMFFLVVVPLGWIIRLFGHDLMRLRRRPDDESYWISRDPAIKSSLQNQF